MHVTGSESNVVSHFPFEDIRNGAISQSNFEQLALLKLGMNVQQQMGIIAYKVCFLEAYHCIMHAQKENDFLERLMVVQFRIIFTTISCSFGFIDSGKAAGIGCCLRKSVRLVIAS